MYVCVWEGGEMCVHEIRGQHLHLLNSSSHSRETGFSLNLHGTDSAKPAVHQAPRILCLCLFNTVKFIGIMSTACSLYMGTENRTQICAARATKTEAISQHILYALFSFIYSLWKGFCTSSECWIADQGTMLDTVKSNQLNSLIKLCS